MLSKAEKSFSWIKHRQWILVAAVILAYLIFAGYHLSSPGLQYDEGNFINTALGAKNYSAFASHKIFGLNVLILPYYSALKAYIYYPIFKLFGVSIYSIRLPMIVLTALALFILWLGLKRRAGQAVATIILLVLALDTSLIGLTRLDVGPNAIEFFCKCISIFFFYAWLKKKDRLSLFGLLFFLGVGLVNKLNFLWFINALIVATAIVHYGELKKLLLRSKTRLWNIALIGGALILYYGFYLFIAHHFELTSSVSVHALKANLPNWNQFILQTIDGKFFYGYIIGTLSSPLYSIYLYGIFLILLLGLGSYLSDLRKRTKDNKPQQQLYWLSLIIVVLSIAQAMVTSQATAPWHYFSIYPFIMILVGLSIWKVAHLVKDRKLRLILLACPVLFIISYQVFMNVRYLNYYNAGQVNTNWSPAVFSLIDYAKASNSKFVSLNWGTGTQFIAFDNVPNKYFEAWPTLGNVLTPAERTQFYNEFLTQPKQYEFVGFYEQNSLVANTTTTQSALSSYPLINFLNICRSYNLKVIKIKTISYNNKPIYDIYAVQK